MTSAPLILSSTDGALHTITLNRPSKLNALSHAMLSALETAVVEFDGNDDLKVMIVTGAGGRAFSVGADLDELAATSGRPESPMRPGISGAYLSFVDRCTKPLIAAIDGYALAGGLELALLCDVRLATRRSKLGLPEARNSLLGGPGLHLLPRLIPAGEAALMQLSGQPMDAYRAYQIGLIQMIAEDPTQMMTEAQRVATQIAACAPLAVRAIKKIARTGRDKPIQEAVVLARRLEARVFSSADYAEAGRAFSERRPPRWIGK